MGVYCRAEEFRSVKFFVSTVGKADRPGGGVRLGSRLTGWKRAGCLAVNWAALLDSGLGTALALSTEVRARRRGHSTQHRRQETGERREERRDILEIA